MSGFDGLTPRQQRVGRRAVRVLEIRGVRLMVPVVLGMTGAIFAFSSYGSLARDPVDALWRAGTAGFLIATAGVMVADTSSLVLLGILYRRLQEVSPEEQRAAPGSGAPMAAKDLPEAERQLVENAGKLGRLGWGAVRGGLLVALASGVAVVAAAIWRFGSEGEGLGTAALAMAATGGLTVGVALGGLVVTRWMRLAARLGAPSPDGRSRV